MDYGPKWYERLLEARPEVVAEVQLRFAVSEFRTDSTPPMVASAGKFEAIGPWMTDFNNASLSTSACSLSYYLTSFCLRLIKTLPACEVQAGDPNGAREDLELAAAIKSPDLVSFASPKDHRLPFSPYSRKKYFNTRADPIRLSLGQSLFAAIDPKKCLAG